MEKAIASLEELEQEAHRFLDVVPHAVSGATLVTLSGDLGAGKTAFTKAIAKALGVEESVTSPTFVLEKIYALPEGSAFTHLIHIDAYRLKEGGDLASIGFDEVMKDAGNLVMLEWPERVLDGLPSAAVSITLEVLGENGRRITYA